MAIAAGPVIGGVVIDGLSWHWIFLLNVPIGLVLIPVAVIRLTESFGPRPHLDVVGVVLAGLGFLGLTWGVVRANTIGWGTSEVIGTVLAGALLIGLFLVWERPLVDEGAGQNRLAVLLVGDSKPVEPVRPALVEMPLDGDGAVHTTYYCGINWSHDWAVDLVSAFTVRGSG